MRRFVLGLLALGGLWGSAAPLPESWLHRASGALFVGEVDAFPEELLTLAQQKKPVFFLVSLDDLQSDATIKKALNLQAQGVRVVVYASEEPLPPTLLLEGVGVAVPDSEADEGWTLIEDPETYQAQLEAFTPLLSAKLPVLTEEFLRSLSEGGAPQ